MMRRQPAEAIGRALLSSRYWCRSRRPAHATLLAAAAAAQQPIRHLSATARRQSSPTPQKRIEDELDALVKKARGGSLEPVPEAPKIAVVGAGLTGLTTAYYLAQDLPADSKIVVYEGSDRVGGWIRSEATPVDVGGVKSNVLFERGPRSVSPGDMMHGQQDRLILYDLIMNHGLSPRGAPRDLARYIYSPEGHLVQLGQFTLDSLRDEPIQRTLILAGIIWTLKWRFRRHGWFPSDEDVSLGEYIARASGSRSVVDDVASAGVHGIWGGDVDQLSAMSALGFHFQAAGMRYREANEVGRRLTEKMFVNKFLERRPHVKQMYSEKPPAVMNFGKHGMESLPMGIANSLESDDRVEMRLGNAVKQIKYQPGSKKIEIQDSKQNVEVYDKVISTLPAHHAYSITDGKLPSIKDAHAVSIMTVNLWYPQEDLVPKGLGYLIPKGCPEDLNPERALGVFFDSNVAVDQHAQEKGTKLFVLMGGHYYDNVQPPSREEAIQQAKTLLHRHLGIPLEVPCHAMANLTEGCLPQHYVGHHRNMTALSAELESGFGNRLALVGGSYSRPGVAGSLRAGYDIAYDTVHTDFLDNGVLKLSHEQVSNPHFPLEF